MYVYLVRICNIRCDRAWVWVCNDIAFYPVVNSLFRRTSIIILHTSIQLQSTLSNIFIDSESLIVAGRNYIYWYYMYYHEWWWPPWFIDFPCIKLSFSPCFMCIFFLLIFFLLFFYFFCIFTCFGRCIAYNTLWTDAVYTLLAKCTFTTCC